jgi:hypothetical protein
MSMAHGPLYNLFICPHCNAELNPGRGPIIKLRGRLDAETFSVTTDVFLPSGLGVYGRLAATGVTLRQGAKFQFFCPDCKQPLSESDQANLAHVKMVDEEGKEFFIGFNKSYGKRSTFVVDPQHAKVERSFGDDADDYRERLDQTLEKKINFFGS